MYLQDRGTFSRKTKTTSLENRIFVFRTTSFFEGGITLKDFNNAADDFFRHLFIKRMLVLLFFTFNHKRSVFKMTNKTEFQ